MTAHHHRTCRRCWRSLSSRSFQFLAIRCRICERRHRSDNLHRNPEIPMNLKPLKTAKGEMARAKRLKERELAIIAFINERGGVCSDADLKLKRGYHNSARELVKLQRAKVVRVDGQWRVFDALAAAGAVA